MNYFKKKIHLSEGPLFKFFYTKDNLGLSCLKLQENAFPQMFLGSFANPELFEPIAHFKKLSQSLFPNTQAYYGRKQHLSRQLWTQRYNCMRIFGFSWYSSQLLIKHRFYFNFCFDFDETDIYGMVLLHILYIRKFHSASRLNMRSFILHILQMRKVLFRLYFKCAQCNVVEGIPVRTSAYFVKLHSFLQNFLSTYMLSSIAHILCICLILFNLFEEGAQKNLRNSSIAWYSLQRESLQKMQEGVLLDLKPTKTNSCIAPERRKNCFCIF